MKSQLTQALKDKAATLGFGVVGIIPAAVLSDAEKQPLRDWLAEGHQAEMQWMVNHLEKRLDPASLMEGTKSIVCVAMNYFSPDEYDDLKIAKYARGTDYHNVLKDRLKELLAFVQRINPAIKGRALTDSAPIWERALAVKAGLGWVGKNGNVILPQKGSFYFLGELLLDIELDYNDAFTANHCGSCTRCIDSCPTDAIVSNGTVDSRKCISYWTIEYKGDVFPENISRNLNGWIFGCDICQDVCPWNVKFSTPATEEQFASRPWNIAPNADEILALDEETFREQHRKSPIKRTKLAGLQRNVREAGLG